LTFPSTIDFKCNLDSIQNILKIENASILGVMTKSDSTIIIIYGQRNYPTYREQGLFIYPIGFKGLSDSIMSTRYSLPGNEINIEDSIVYTSRVFYGTCSEKYPFSIVWYQKERTNDWKWSKSTFILAFSKNNFTRKLLDTDSLSLWNFENNTRNGLCKELSPMQIYIEP
jgi:hypothetical protein